MLLANATDVLAALSVMVMLPLYVADENEALAVPPPLTLVPAVVAVPLVRSTKTVVPSVWNVATSLAVLRSMARFGPAPVNVAGARRSSSDSTRSRRAGRRIRAGDRAGR